MSAMRPKKPLLLSILLLIVFTQSRTADAVSESGVSSGSRLYYTSARLEVLKKRIATDSDIEEAWDKLIEKAERLLDERLVSKEYAESGEGQHGNYGRPSSQIAGMGMTLGLAYRMTGEKKYAEKLREAMLHFGKLNRWAGDANRDPPWHSELNTARFCLGYGVGYDSIRDYLSPADRKAIERPVF